MRKEDLQDAIGNIDEKYLDKVDKNRNYSQTSTLKRWVLVAAAFAIILYSGINLYRAYDKKYLLSEADTVKFNDIDEYKTEEIQNVSKVNNGLKSFFEKSKNTILDSKSEGNQIYSPINTYIAYSILAEITNTETREELMELIGIEDISNLKEEMQDLISINQIDDNDEMIKIANSLWLKEADKEDYKKEMLDILSKYYYASIYSGDFEDEKYSEAFRNWVNKNTNDLLKDLMKDYKFATNNALSLASTIYLKNSWYSKFYKTDNTFELFNTGKEEKKIEFMNNEFSNSPYIKTDDFEATSLILNSNGTNMWFFLPREDKTVSDVLENNNLYDVIDSIEDLNTYSLLLSLPKFTIESDINLVEKTKEMGVKKIFEDNADFSNITDNSLRVSNFNHKVKLIVNEDGVEAAAVTIVDKETAMALPQNDTVELKLDRPFIFIITGEDNVPLFTGIVNNPQ